MNIGVSFARWVCWGPGLDWRPCERRKNFSSHGASSTSWQLEPRTNCKKNNYTASLWKRIMNLALKACWRTLAGTVFLNIYMFFMKLQEIIPHATPLARYPVN